MAQTKGAQPALVPPARVLALACCGIRRPLPLGGPDWHSAKRARDPRNPEFLLSAWQATKLKGMGSMPSPSCCGANDRTD